MQSRDNQNSLKGLIPTGNRAGMQQQLIFDDTNSGQHIIIQKPKSKVIFIIGIISIVAAISIFAVTAIISYKYSSKPHSLDEIKLVRRDLNPVKVEPLEPGGERFSNQDITVYEAIEKDRSALASTKKVQLEELEKVVAAKSGKAQVNKVVEPKAAEPKAAEELKAVEPKAAELKKVEVEKPVVKKAEIKKEDRKLQPTLKLTPKPTPKLTSRPSADKVVVPQKKAVSKKDVPATKPSNGKQAKPKQVKDIFDLAE